MHLPTNSPLKATILGFHSPYLGISFRSLGETGLPSLSLALGKILATFRVKRGRFITNLPRSSKNLIEPPKRNRLSSQDFLHLLAEPAVLAQKMLEYGANGQQFPVGNVGGI